MSNLGNAWHIPDNPEPRGRGGMRDPIGAIVPGTAITIVSGNQFQGGGNPGNQLQTGSSVFFKRATDAAWTELPMTFYRTFGNNKYYTATIRADVASGFQVDEAIQYYLRVAYDDHDTTFVQANGGLSAPTESEADAQAAPFTFTVESSTRWGRWDPPFELPNVAIHTTVLPDGRVLMWGRREAGNPSLDVHSCTPFVWNPKTLEVTFTAQPTKAPTPEDPEETVNLFCASHAFLSDGRLLVVGGHLADGNGVNQASIFDYRDDSWTPTAKMSSGRWYPTATTLPDGGVLVLGGSYFGSAPSPGGNPEIIHNDVPEVWKNGTWTPLREFIPGGRRTGDLELYPRLHVISDGKVFMPGPLQETYLLDPANGGSWQDANAPRDSQRDYCPSVMYDMDKVVYIGGGNDAPPPGQQTPRPPTNAVFTIDLQANPREWERTGSMKYPRRQHDATLLPDGTVLVTGGTRGGGGPDPGRRDDSGFNDLRQGQPVHAAEVWDPATGTWTELVAEEVDRCYHATAVLLPDGRVLSAGGGEYRPFDGLGDMSPNPDQDSHRTAQIFSPPYLFKGRRPVITSAPTSVRYGQTFDVATDQPAEIDKVRWIRLPSVTHAFDQSQRINVLSFQVVAGKLRVTAPASPSLCPPGPYMLFTLNAAGVPSEAWIVQMQADPALAQAAVTPRPQDVAYGAYEAAAAPQAAAAAAPEGTRVIVGISGTCPYGIAACWGGAHEALSRLEGVAWVSPIADANDSTAAVVLGDDYVPALDRWDAQFRSIVGGRYVLRGVEITLRGRVEERNGQLVLAASRQWPDVQLARLEGCAKVQWDRAAGASRSPDDDEPLAFERLAASVRGRANGEQVAVTGPLIQTDRGYRLHVRLLGV